MNIYYTFINVVAYMLHLSEYLYGMKLFFHSFKFLRDHKALLFDKKLNYDSKCKIGLFGMLKKVKSMFSVLKSALLKVLH